MAITSITSERLVGGVWQITATSDLEDPTFYWYLDGILADVTRAGTKQLNPAPGEYIQVDVFDDPEAAVGQVYPSRGLISTSPDAQVARSLVQEYVDDEWVTVHTARGAHVTYQTRVLDDGETVQMRVVPVNEAGIEGRPRPLEIAMVRKPDLPAVAAEYDSNTTRITLVAE